MDSNLSSTHASPANLSLLLKKDIEKIEFYNSYDVMTGVRIAATLGSFFSIMVVLVVYKSKCKSRSESDEKLEAAVARQLAAAAAGNLPSALRGPPPPHHQPPPSLSAASAVALQSNHHRLHHPFHLPSHPEYWEEESHQGQEWLAVPTGSDRRLSSLTNSSFYLDRRDSLMDMPCLSVPPLAYRSQPQIFHHIDIQVTRPTPEMSRSGSGASLGVNVPGGGGPVLGATGGWAQLPRAPLASAGSSALSARSTSDSVFLDDELIDTEDEVDGFTTDSDPESPESPQGNTLLSPNLSQPTLVQETSPSSLVGGRWQQWQWSAPQSMSIFTVCSGAVRSPSRSASAGHLPPPPLQQPTTKSLAALCWSTETLF